MRLAAVSAAISLPAVAVSLLAYKLRGVNHMPRPPGYPGLPYVSVRVTCSILRRMPIGSALMARCVALSWPGFNESSR